MFKGVWNINFKRVCFAWPLPVCKTGGGHFFVSVPYLFHQKALNCGGFEERNRWYRCYITSKNREKNIKEKEYIGNRRFICTICSKALIFLCFQGLDGGTDVDRSSLASSPLTCSRTSGYSESGFMEYSLDFRLSKVTLIKFNLIYWRTGFVP